MAKEKLLLQLTSCGTARPWTCSRRSCGASFSLPPSILFPFRLLQVAPRFRQTLEAAKMVLYRPINDLKSMQLVRP